MPAFIKTYMIYFDNKLLEDTLAPLPLDLKVVFAAACAQRLLPYYTEYLKKIPNTDTASVIPNALQLLWQDLNGTESLDVTKLNELVDECIAAVPNEEQAWNLSEPYAEDAATAVVYALQTKLKGSEKLAVLCAQKIYDVLDNWVINNGALDNSQPDYEDKVLGNSVIQKELLRQVSDVKRLASAAENEQTSKDIIEIMRRESESASLF